MSIRLASTRSQITNTFISVAEAREARASRSRAALSRSGLEPSRAKPWVWVHRAEPSRANQNAGFLRLDYSSALVADSATVATHCRIVESKQNASPAQACPKAEAATLSQGLENTAPAPACTPTSSTPVPVDGKVSSACSNDEELMVFCVNR